MTDHDDNVWPGFVDLLAFVVVFLLLCLVLVASDKLTEDAERVAYVARVEERMTDVGARLADFPEQKTLNPREDSLPRMPTCTRSGLDYTCRFPDSFHFGTCQTQLPGTPGETTTLQMLATTINELDGVLEGVVVEGHTDATPVVDDCGKSIATNWELSAGRAAHITRRLVDDYHVRAGLLRATGFAEHAPLPRSGMVLTPNQENDRQRFVAVTFRIRAPEATP